MVHMRLGWKLEEFIPTRVSEPLAFLTCEMCFSRHVMDGAINSTRNTDHRAPDISVKLITHQSLGWSILIRYILQK